MWIFGDKKKPLMDAYSARTDMEWTIRRTKKWRADWKNDWQTDELTDPLVGYRHHISTFYFAIEILLNCQFLSAESIRRFKRKILFKNWIWKKEHKGPVSNTKNTCFFAVWINEKRRFSKRKIQKEGIKLKQKKKKSNKKVNK